MSRTAPVHAGYTILNGVGTGPNGGRIDVWVEYKTGTQDVSGNDTPITAYFYAALNPNYSSSTSYSSGLNSAFTVDGKAGTAVSNGAYDFSSAAKVNLLGSFSGNIPHNADGTKNVTFAGSFTTVSSYISGGNISKTVTLPPIPKAAAVTAEDAILGENCHITWTPASADHSFTLEFSLDSWNLATGRLYPKTTGKAVYTDTVLPLEAARQFLGNTGSVQVKLTTYNGNTVLGSSETSFAVTVPETEMTCPVVNASLAPECQAFPGLYVQRLGKVRATVTAEDPLGAKIADIQLTVGTVTKSGTVSDNLEQAGTLAVTVTAVSSRGFTGKWTGEIFVNSYDSPRLTEAAAYRCLSDGTADPGGTFLGLQAERVFSTVQERNTCSLRWRYKPEDGAYCDWIPFTGTAAGVALEKNKTYTVQISAIDSAGSTDIRTISIPAEQVYMHRTRNAMGLGGYVQGSEVLDLYWDLQARKSICGAYIRAFTPGQSFTLRFTDPGKQQTALLIGSIQGVVTLSGDTPAWQGSGGVSVTAQSGAVTFTLSGQIGGRLLILSPDPIEI